MSHLDKYGKFLTSELRDQLAVPFTKKCLDAESEKLIALHGLEACDQHVIVMALILDHCFADPRRDGFIDLFQCVQSASTKVAKEIKLDDSNSIVIVRGHQMVREFIGISDLIVDEFIDVLHERRHWTTNYLNSGKLSQYHPFVQYLYLIEAQDKAIAALEESLPTVPAEEIDVPAN